MTGAEIFDGLSYVDERFVDEAETGKLSGGIPWMKILSVAACLSILLAGAFAMDISLDKTTAEVPLAGVPAADEPAAVAPKEDTCEGEMDFSFQDAASAAGELHQVPYAKLQVVNVFDDGSFEAMVKATQPMEVDTLVTVVVDLPETPEAEETIADSVSIVAGAQIEIYDGTYDAKNNTLYVTRWLPIEQGG